MLLPLDQSEFCKELLGLKHFESCLIGSAVVSDTLFHPAICDPFRASVALWFISFRCLRHPHAKRFCSVFSSYPRCLSKLCCKHVVALICAITVLRQSDVYRILTRNVSTVRRTLIGDSDLRPRAVHGALFLQECDESLARADSHGQEDAICFPASKGLDDCLLQPLDSSGVFCRRELSGRNAGLGLLAAVCLV
jgi:hypothetical protein